MILTTKILLDRLKDYSNPFGKMGRMVKDGLLLPLVRGLYEDNPSASGFYLAGAIYGPSYISFNSALSYHGLIPEAVYAFTSATCEKKKIKSYVNSFGTFTYRDVPAEIFPYGVLAFQQEGYSFLVASPEKALCDKLYETTPVKNQKQLAELLFDDMRIDESLFDKLHRDDIYFLSQKYHSINLLLLDKYLRRKYRE